MEPILSAGFTSASQIGVQAGGIWHPLGTRSRVATDVSRLPDVLAPGWVRRRSAPKSVKDSLYLYFGLQKH
jgi:hypothetical protein